MTILICNKLKALNNRYLNANSKIVYFHAINLESIDNDGLFWCSGIAYLNCPRLMRLGEMSLGYNTALKNLILDNIIDL